jgi:hypothetical protein
MNTKITQPQIKVNPSIGVQRGVSKEVEEGHKPPALRAAILETTVRLFQGWPSAGRRKVGHAGP